jgi:hypothetical protein
MLLMPVVPKMRNPPGFSWFEHAVPIIIMNSERKSLQSTHDIDLQDQGDHRDVVGRFCPGDPCNVVADCFFLK